MDVGPDDRAGGRGNYSERAVKIPVTLVNLRWGSQNFTS